MMQCVHSYSSITIIITVIKGSTSSCAFIGAPPLSNLSIISQSPARTAEKSASELYRESFEEKETLIMMHYNLRIVVRTSASGISWGISKR